MNCVSQESDGQTASELSSESTSAGELTKQQARHANELADVKKKFMAVARRKQQDYNKKVCMYNKPASVSDTWRHCAHVHIQLWPAGMTLCAYHQ